MLLFRDRRARIVLLAALLVVAGVAAYLIVESILANRQLDAAKQALKSYDFTRASAHLKNYLSSRPKDVSALRLAAQTARRQGAFDEATARLSQAEKHGLSAETAAIERQLLKIQGGDLTSAPQLAKFCAEKPNDPEAPVALEVMIEGALRGLNPPLAKWGAELWLKHQTASIDQAQGLVWRGRANELLQDFPQALADFRRAVELAPEHAQARLRLVEGLIREEPRRAVVHLEWLHLHRGDDPEVRFQTARLRRALGQPDEAASLLDGLLADEPERVAALVERGRVALDLHDHKKAEVWLRRAESLAPDKRDVNLALADCLRQAGRLDEARHYQDVADEIEARLKKALEELTRSSKGPGEPP